MLSKFDGIIDNIAQILNDLAKLFLCAMNELLTDIDKDILDMETIKKNMIMKDRKLNAEGGRIGYAGGGKAGLPAISQGLPPPGIQQPQMPAMGPQPAGIPGGTIVAQNQMQQAPWMGPQMQQGIGGMPRPQPQGQPRMPFGLGGNEVFPPIFNIRISSSIASLLRFSEDK